MYVLGIFFKKPAKTIKSGLIIFNSSNTLEDNWSLLKYKVSIFEYFLIFKKGEFILFENTLITDILSESLNWLTIFKAFVPLPDINITIFFFH